MAIKLSTYNIHLQKHCYNYCSKANTLENCIRTNFKSQYLYVVAVVLSTLKKYNYLLDYFDDELKIGDVKYYDNMTEITIRVQLF